MPNNIGIDVLNTGIDQTPPLDQNRNNTPIPCVPKHLYLYSAQLRRILQPSIDFLLRLALRVAIALLQAPRQLFALAFDNIKVIISELAPLSRRRRSRMSWL
jgi:hypothetical protein